MCGRFTLRSSPQAVAEAFALPDVPELFPRFNIAPGQPVAVVRQEPRAEGRELALLRWGLIPMAQPECPPMRGLGASSVGNE